jgi:TRAP transporter TAXI family solute receptor
MTDRHPRAPRPALWLAAIGLTAGLMAIACNPQEMGSRSERLSVATGGTGGVYYPYGGGVAKVISDHLEGVEATAEVTAGSVDNLKFIANGSADLGIVLADSLDDAYQARGVFAEFGAVPTRALAVLYDNYNHVVTTTAKEISTIGDLRDRVISTGAPGSGTEISAFRILEAAGVNPETDIRRQSLGAAQSVDALKDNKIDAFFWSGGIPTGSVLDFATTPGRTIRIVANAALLPSLAGDYGATVYHVSTIPSSTYPGMETSVDVIAVANVLVVHEEMSDELAYRIVQALFEHHDEMSAIHPMAALLTLENAVTGSPVPFHPGAARYYAEQGRPVE